MYLDELQTALRAETGRTFSTSVLYRALKRYDLPRMQLNLKAEQRSERAFRECQARLKTYDPRLFVFLDETHVDITRLTSLGGS